MVSLSLVSFDLIYDIDGTSHGASASSERELHDISLQVLKYRWDNGYYRLTDTIPDLMMCSSSVKLASAMWDHIRRIVDRQDGREAFEFLVRRSEDGYVNEGFVVGQD